MRRLATGLGLHRRDPGRSQGRQCDQADFGQVDFLQQAAGPGPDAVDGSKPDTEAVDHLLLEHRVHFASAGEVEQEPAFDDEALSGFADLGPSADRLIDLVRPEHERGAAVALVLGQRLGERTALDGVAQLVDFAEHRCDAFERAGVIRLGELDLDRQVPQHPVGGGCIGWLSHPFTHQHWPAPADRRARCSSEPSAHHHLPTAVGSRAP
jgi:hypothetical protein